ncbi:MAG TPA: phage tail protein [Candidatus Limnocylindria bacterium]|nr:phage tail protein [Candidatus Limnocylindria bacterium]
MPKGLPNLPTDALSSYTFGVEIQGVEIAQFMEVSGLASEIDVIELKENTPDGKLIIHKAPGAAKPPTLTLKRAKSSSKDLWDWHQNMLQGKISDARKDGSIILKSYDGTEVARYNFTNAWVSKLDVSALKAGSNEVLTESASIVCESLERAS